ncbi:hypothetical protein VPH35_077362 [Triticum aestivum]
MPLCDAVPRKRTGGILVKSTKTSFFSSLAPSLRRLLPCPALLCSALYKKSGLLLHKHTPQNKTPATHTEAQTQRELPRGPGLDPEPPLLAPPEENSNTEQALKASGNAERCACLEETSPA